MATAVEQFRREQGLDKPGREDFEDFGLPEGSISPEELETEALAATETVDEDLLALTEETEGLTPDEQAEIDSLAGEGQASAEVAKQRIGFWSKVWNRLSGLAAPEEVDFGREEAAKGPKRQYSGGGGPRLGPEAKSDEPEVAEEAGQTRQTRGAVIEESEKLKGVVNELIESKATEHSPGRLAGLREKLGRARERAGEMLGTAKELALNPEVQKGVAKAAYETVTSVFGVKFATDLVGATFGKGDIAGYFKERKLVKAEKEEIQDALGALVKVAQERKLDKQIMSAEEAAQEGRGREVSPVKKELREKIKAYKEKLESAAHLSPEDKRAFREQLGTLVAVNVHSEEALSRDRAKDVNHVLNTYLETKIKGTKLVKDALNFGLTASGLVAVRGVTYGVMAGIERLNKTESGLEKEHLQKERKAALAGEESARDWKEDAGRLLKDLFVNSTRETVQALAFKGDKSKGRKTVEFAQAMGALARGLGIGGAAFGEMMGSSLSHSLTKSADTFLNAYEQSGAVGAVGHNFVNNAERMIHVYTHPIDSLTGRFGHKPAVGAERPRVAGAGMMGGEPAPVEPHHEASRAGESLGQNIVEQSSVRPAEVAPDTAHVEPVIVQPESTGVTSEKPPIVPEPEVTKEKADYSKWWQSEQLKKAMAGEAVAEAPLTPPAGKGELLPHIPGQAKSEKFDVTKVWESDELRRTLEGKGANPETTVVSEPANITEITHGKGFQEAPLPEKHAELDKLVEENKLTKWEDVIDDKKHNSIWSTTREIVRAHADELGYDEKKGVPLDKWLETQTANMVNQLQHDQGGQLNDLVHEGDKVTVYVGADNKPYLRFGEAEGGPKAGFLHPETATARPQAELSRTGNQELAPGVASAQEEDLLRAGTRESLMRSEALPLGEKPANYAELPLEGKLAQYLPKGLPREREILTEFLTKTGEGKFRPGEELSADKVLGLMEADQHEYYRFRAKEALRDYLENPSQEKLNRLKERVIPSEIDKKFGPNSWKQVQASFDGKNREQLRSLQSMVSRLSLGG